MVVPKRSQFPMEPCSVLSVLGLLVVARWVLYVVLDVVAAIRKFLWAPLLRDDLALKYGGKWAVVTGCTDGIGKEYARRLAARGMNILLISRNIDKLNNVQQLIKKESPGVETETVQVDFSHGRIVYEKIARHLVGKNVGILVNNVGVLLNPPMKFAQVSENDVWNHINVNVASVAAMTHLVLPAMLARGSGAIINISSLASCFPVPYMGIYSGTKTFVEYFSESLSWELRGCGVTIQTLTPGFIVSNMTSFSEDLMKPSFLVPTTSAFVASALATLGHAARTSGYWPHGIQQFLYEKVFPRSCSMWSFEWAIKRMVENKPKKN